MNQESLSLHRDLEKARMVGHHGNDVKEAVDAVEEQAVEDFAHDPVFLEQQRLARYRQTPLLVPFPPLDREARTRLGPLALPTTGWHTDRGYGRQPTPPSSPYGQSGMVRSGSPRTHSAASPFGTKSMGGLDLHSRDGGTLLPRGSLTARPGVTAFPTTGNSKAIEEFRVALPLDSVPRLSPRSTRVLRESAYGRTAWDRTDTTHMRATTPEVRGRPSSTHTDNLRPWADADWKQWQSNPATRHQSPRSQWRLEAVTKSSKAFNLQKSTNKAPEKDDVKGAGTKPYLGSELTREWWKAHQTNIQPWKTEFARAKTPKRSVVEVWPAAGRGVMDGWYTPRTSTPERLAKEQARQAKILNDCMNTVHDADAAQNAEDAEDALASLDDAEDMVAKGAASGLGQAAIAFAKALDFSQEGDGVRQRVEVQKERVLMGLAAQLAPFAPPDPRRPASREASLVSVKSASSGKEEAVEYELLLEVSAKRTTSHQPQPFRRNFPRAFPSSSPQAAPLTHRCLSCVFPSQRYKFLVKLATKESGIPEEIIAHVKVCGRKAPKVGDMLVVQKSTVNTAAPPPGTTSQTMSDLENGIAAYKVSAHQTTARFPGMPSERLLVCSFQVYLFFKPRDRNAHGKLKRAQTTLRQRCVSMHRFS